MPLVTINDLLTQPAEIVAKCQARAGDLLDIYEKFIEEDDEDVSFLAGWHGASNRSSGNIHASELSGKCKRPSWYSLMGDRREDSKLDPFWKKRFRIGHMYHEMVQEDWRRLCEKSKGMMSFEKEAKIHPSLQDIAQQYGIESSSDGIINFHLTPYGPIEMRVGLEIKTESPDQFAKIKEVKEQHQRQTCVYMRCLDVPILWTMYINKGNQNIVPSKYPYLFTFDFDLWNVIQAEAVDVIRLAVLNEIPERAEGISCEFCGFAHLCQPEYLQKRDRRKKAKKERALMQDRLRVGLRAPRRAS